MQIGNDYTGYQSSSYGHAHTHHLTECMHEEEQKKDKAGITGADKVNTYKKGDAAKQAVEYIASFSIEEMSHNKEKRKTGMWKGFWDALGEDGKGQPGIDFRQNFMNGIHAAAINAQTFFSEKVVHNLMTVRDKIKAVPAEAIKKFGKGKEAFDAFLGGSTTSGQKNQENKKKEKKEIETGQPVNAHLMDSYNRTGGYCQLHENLTYQKPKSK